MNSTLELSYQEQLMTKLRQKKAVVGVIGMGYVGLPNMTAKAMEGYTVIGFDTDTSKVNAVNAGENYIGDVDSKTFKQYVEKGMISATTSFAELRACDVIQVCVPTPIDKHKQPDMRFVKAAAKEIRKNAKRGALVILESTTYPGTTKGYFVKGFEQENLLAFEQTAAEIGKDIFIAYSPERIDPSNLVFNVHNTPRVVGGYTSACTELAATFIGGKVYQVSSLEAAEMAKVYENTFRYVNIALANELAIICGKIDLDVWEVIDAAGTKPFGFMPFYPSAGIGGHCIPVDPFYLSWYARKYNISTRMIDLASDINDGMTDFTIAKINEILNAYQKTLSGSRIALLGAAYKKDIDDVRESGIFRLYSNLRNFGADLTVIDPHVKVFTTEGGDVIDIMPPENVDFKDFDLIVLLTDHSSFNYQSIADAGTAILDTKNAFKYAKTGTEFFKL